MKQKGLVFAGYKTDTDIITKKVSKLRNFYYLCDV